MSKTISFTDTELLDFMIDCTEAKMPDPAALVLANKAYDEVRKAGGNYRQGIRAGMAATLHLYKQTGRA